MSRTLMWANNGDLLMSGGRLRTNAGLSVVQDRIFFLLRARFDMKKYIGYAPTEERTQKLQAELETFLAKKLPFGLETTVTISNRTRNGFDVNFYIDVSGLDTEHTFSMQYNNGQWTYTEVLAADDEVLETTEPDNLLNR